MSIGLNVSLVGDSKSGIVVQLVERTFLKKRKIIQRLFKRNIILCFENVLIQHNNMFLMLFTASLFFNACELEKASVVSTKHTGLGQKAK